MQRTIYLLMVIHSVEIIMTPNEQILQTSEDWMLVWDSSFVCIYNFTGTLNRGPERL